MNEKSQLGPALTLAIALLTLAVHGGVLWQKVDTVSQQLTKLTDHNREIEQRVARLEARCKE